LLDLGCALYHILACVIFGRQLAIPLQLAKFISSLEGVWYNMSYRGTLRPLVISLVLVSLLLWGCSQCNPARLDDVRLFFIDYGWNIREQIAQLDTVIPIELKEQQSSSPASVYWVMVNAYSNAIGLDMREYAGEKVQLEIFRLVENPQERLAGQYEFPSWFEESGRALIVRQDDQIIGAWLDQTGRYGYSLTGKSIKGITGLSVEDWLDEVRGAEDAAEKSPEPEDVIRAYFSSYAAGDSVSAFERLSSRFMLEHVFSNLDENKLYNADFQPLPRGADAEVISIVEQANPEPDAVTGNKRLFCVKFNLELSANIASGYTEGMNERFFSMVRTLDKLGWKIDAIGTGF
jgi:hypothetical protein